MQREDGKIHYNYSNSDYNKELWGHTLMKIEEVDEVNPKKILNRAWFALFILAFIYVVSQTFISVLIDRFWPQLAQMDWQPQAY